MPSRGVVAVSSLAAVGTLSILIYAFLEWRKQRKLQKMATKMFVQRDADGNIDYAQLGIGGLDKELAALRRVFDSRCNPELANKLGMKHVRGIILHGPPGTGKTLIAKRIGNLVNAKTTKLISASEPLNKYVGETEKYIRELFTDAEHDQAKYGSKSGLHVIIFDEFDGLCKARGSSECPVNDKIVTALNSKMDGLKPLNNILVIGITNHFKVVDKALLRPGRFEVHVKIDLPDEAGRLDIFKIHTATLRENNMLDEDVDLHWLAKKAKGYSGAAIEGLVGRAKEFAWSRIEQGGGKVNMNDFKRALGQRVEQEPTVEPSRHEVVSKKKFNPLKKAIKMLNNMTSDKS